MTTYQQGKNIVVSYKVEGATIGVAAASGAGATQFRASPGAGGNMKRPTVKPTEFRSDGQSTQVRLGSKSVSLERLTDLSVGTFDALFEAAMRGTWTAAFTITQSDMTSITTTAHTIVAASGSWIAKGVKVGQVIRITTDAADAANLNINLRVTGVSASTITVAETLVADAVPLSTFTVTVSKTLVQGIPQVRRSFTWDEYLTDIDLSKLFVGCRISKIMLSFKPDATVTVTFSLVGIDMQPQSSGESPYFTAPTLSTSIPLEIVDGKVHVNGIDAVDFTSFDVTYDIGGATLPVIGSVTSPDVFQNPAVVSGSLTGARADFTRLNLYASETQFDVHVLCVEPMSEPKNFLAFYFGNVKATDNTDQLGNDGAQIETIPVNMGADTAGGGSAPTMLLISTSAP